MGNKQLIWRRRVKNTEKQLLSFLANIKHVSQNVQLWTHTDTLADTKTTKLGD